LAAYRSGGGADFGSFPEAKRGAAMKQRIPVIIAALSGLVMLAALFFQPFTAPYLGLALNWRSSFQVLRYWWRSPAWL
jgi:hypothetical protein